MQVITTYFAIEVKDENGIWHKPACWKVEKKWLLDRVRQLRAEGQEVRVKRVTEYLEEEIILEERRIK